MRGLFVGAVLFFGSLGVIWLGVGYFHQRAIDARAPAAAPYVPPPILSPQRRGP